MQRCPGRYHGDVGRKCSFLGRETLVLPVFPHKGFLTASREKTQGDSSLGAQHLAEGRSRTDCLSAFVSEKCRDCSSVKT